jgi:hypothetical protein
LEIVMVKRSLEAANAIMAGNSTSLIASVSMTHSTLQMPGARRSAAPKGLLERRSLRFG